ncbi:MULTISPECIES: aldehyde dehydrogenase family protein [unclassified Janthinobacterium]|uniref:aldehyde dehydrogenase family protein n=1 Tax=unclassified Janthinobacterium TaxID=2610881 RepID=UPI00161E3F6F|nr:MULTISPECIES: aldehyde dehydrogenase family protein [unclassified Janthinobacterium]MBB5605776.1 aldehyde dehydrogenase (NAD+) [Janthinobacterium sp. S3T4]MBB5611305.1 aldehyde dehydrogenase (NAD+) [Janthinobacterium sp. S3M3]
MKTIDQIYINGQFLTPHGTQQQELINPTTGQLATRVVLGDAADVDAAVAAAKAAYVAYSRTSKQERMAILQRLHEAVAARSEELVQVMVEEYGGTLAFCRASVQRAANSFLQTKQLLETFDFVRTAGSARVVLEPLGVVGIITPWNSSYGFICSKLATALAAGSTAVIKPSELSAAQTQILAECLHAAQLPPGLFNIVNGSGEIVGNAITAHPDIAKISFTGSTAVGKHIARGAIDTLKRVTLELGGKSPNVLLDDADLDLAIPTAVAAFTFNSGQACLAGTRLIVPASRLEEIKQRIKVAVDALKVGDPANADTQIGPLVNAAQYARVQRYIALGTEEGATLLTGGAGHPAGLENGYFVKPTVFVNVRNDMAIAREEIFGPVLSIISYDSEEEAIAIANDTVYGLQAYVSSGDQARANRVAAQLVAGRVFINGLYDEPLAPFGGFKQSGIGREFGTYGLEAYLEPKAMMGYSASNEIY